MADDAEPAPHSSQRTVFVFGVLVTAGRRYARQRVAAWITDATGRTTLGFLFIRGGWLVRVNWRELERAR